MWKWICEVIAITTGAAVTGAIFQGHEPPGVWGWVVGGVVFIGIGMVVEKAGNGNQRLGMALGELIVKLETKIEPPFCSTRPARE